MNLPNDDEHVFSHNNCPNIYAISWDVFVRMYKVWEGLGYLIAESQAVYE